MQSLDEDVAKKLEKMTREGALTLAIAALHPISSLMRHKEQVESEAARRLLILMRRELIGGRCEDNHGR